MAKHNNIIAFDDFSRVYTALYADEMSESLWIDLDLLYTSIPTEPMKIFTGGRHVYDSVEYYYRCIKDQALKK